MINSRSSVHHGGRASTLMSDRRIEQQLKGSDALAHRPVPALPHIHSRQFQLAAHGYRPHESVRGV